MCFGVTTEPLNTSSTMATVTIITSDGNQCFWLMIWICSIHQDEDIMDLHIPTHRTLYKLADCKISQAEMNGSLLSHHTPYTFKNNENIVVLILTSKQSTIVDRYFYSYH